MPQTSPTSEITQGVGDCCHSNYFPPTTIVFTIWTVTHLGREDLVGLHRLPTAQSSPCCGLRSPSGSHPLTTAQTPLLLLGLVMVCRHVLFTAWGFPLFFLLLGRILSIRLGFPLSKLGKLQKKRNFCQCQKDDFALLLWSFFKRSNAK